MKVLASKPLVPLWLQVGHMFSSVKLSQFTTFNNNYKHFLLDLATSNFQLLPYTQTPEKSYLFSICQSQPLEPALKDSNTNR